MRQFKEFLIEEAQHPFAKGVNSTKMIELLSKYKWERHRQGAGRFYFTTNELPDVAIVTKYTAGYYQSGDNRTESLECYITAKYQKSLSAKPKEVVIFEKNVVDKEVDKTKKEFSKLIYKITGYKE